MAPNLLLLSRLAIRKLPPAGTAGHFRRGPGDMGRHCDWDAKGPPSVLPPRKHAGRAF